MDESHKQKRKGFTFLKEDFSKKNVIEGGIIRPLIQLIAFFSFVIAIFLLLFSLQRGEGYLVWGASLIIFSFILNLYSIYLSLTDEESIFRSFNLVFKFALFLCEIVAFNVVLMALL